MNIAVSFVLALTPAHAPARSLWVWRTRPILEDRAEQKKFFDFLAAPRGETKNKITTLFFSTEDGDAKMEPKKIKEFLVQAHKRSIRVDYLCGAADFVLPEKQQEGLAHTQWVIDFNKSASKSCRFDGIQYDVEPYSLPDWPKQNILDDYLIFLDRADQKIKDAESSLQLGCAIPRWFDDPPLHGLYKSVIDRVDYVAVMDYVDNSKSFVDDGSNEIAYASEKKKQVWLGAETSELKDEPMATFYAKGEAAMEDAFSSAFKAFAGDKGFAGVAIEHYDPYVVLRP